MNRLGISICALFVLALMLYVPLWMEEDDPLKQNAGSDALRPAYKAKNLTTTIFNSDGKLNHEVFAVSMEHYDQLGFVLFSQPKYTVFVEEGEAPWQVTAVEGTLYDNDLIQLEGNVVIKSLNEDDFIRTITTEFIKVNLDDKTMISDQPVAIRGVQTVIKSNGFNANISTQQYELIDHVQTVYSPGS
ncbi:LPS export ABC transporter periplasmic protein LptC [Alteromonas sp. C1M14]|uniref:LPS export ABC transporter periplasmic protein LptC n=1 Tax=Alteromonas sp. C1M14 TaxID=2841567 RepID=UPI001C09E835|nr:LPS export ABC transporter periplasmic protein LptC [Alteromonas sp. C1M14]MBU2977688.1 LPS export ABC transporter periplasmic protein LptC [Alteromonas sp. C1M14]